MCPNLFFKRLIEACVRVGGECHFVMIPYIPQAVMGADYPDIFLKTSTGNLFLAASEFIAGKLRVSRN